MYRCLFLLIFMPLWLFGQTFDSDSILVLLDHADDDTLVLTDLDNTLIESRQHLGSSQWGDYLNRMYLELGGHHQAAYSICINRWAKVQEFIEIRCVDEHAAHVIEKLHEKGIAVIGLTGRRPLEAENTHRQLSSVNIRMSQHFAPDIQIEQSEDYAFDNGILFCSPAGKKSKALKAFLEKTGYRPKRILFIDDKVSHLKDIEELLLELKIEYVGIRFSKADGRVKAFNPAVAMIQEAFLPKILSDEEAEYLLSR